MTAIELARLVADMRKCQREFFRTKSGTALAAAKVAEGRVDRAVADVLSGPLLFPGFEEAAR